MNVMIHPIDQNSDHLAHIQIHLVNVTKAWARVICRYLEEMYAQYPEWLNDALDLQIRSEFAQVNRVDIKTDNQPMKAYLHKYFGHNQQWLPVVNRSEQVPYYRGFGPQAVVELNHTCEFCGQKGQQQVFGGGQVGWWVVQCDHPHDKTEYALVTQICVDRKGSVSF